MPEEGTLPAVPCHYYIYHKCQWKVIPRLSMGIVIAYPYCNHFTILSRAYAWEYHQNHHPAVHNEMFAVEDFLDVGNTHVSCILRFADIKNLVKH